MLELAEELLEAVRSIERRRGCGPGQAERLRSLAEALRSTERAHHAREERLLFARLRRLGVCVPLDTLAREHEAIGARSEAVLLLVGRLAGGSPPRPGDRALLRSLCEQVREHAFLEETALYPFALDAIAAAEWDRMQVDWDAAG